MNGIIEFVPSDRTIADVGLEESKMIPMTSRRSNYIEISSTTTTTMCFVEKRVKS